MAGGRKLASFVTSTARNDYTLSHLENDRDDTQCVIG